MSGLGTGRLLGDTKHTILRGEKMRKDAEVSRGRSRKSQGQSKSNWRIARMGRLVCVSEKLGSRMGGST